MTRARVEKPPAREPAPVSDLDPTQRARAAACDRARNAVGPRAAFASPPADARDVHAIATFILNGSDPWADVAAQVVDGERQPVGVWIAAWLDDQERIAKEEHARAEALTRTAPPAEGMRAEALRQQAAEAGAAIRLVRRRLGDPRALVEVPVPTDADCLPSEGRP